MATVNFSVPDKVKKKFNLTFAKSNKSQVIARLMMHAVENEMQQRLRVRAIDRLINLRKHTSPITDRSIRLARKNGRS